MYSGNSTSKNYKHKRARQLMDLGYFVDYCGTGDWGIKPIHYFRINKGRKSKDKK
jgi:hypothetical protein